MSRVYDALQQLSDQDQVTPAALQADSSNALFTESTADSVWDPESAPIVRANVSSEDRIPVLFSTYSFASEQFHLLATRLQQLQPSRAFKSILLTSSVAQEGKSLLTLNLAMSLAHGSQQKVLVVDADLRKPGICRTLRFDDQPGIREWYRTNRPVTDFICRVGGVNVWLLPAGQAPVDTLELLKSPRMSGLLASMRGAFDWVLIDSPPLLPVADAEVISSITDGTIIVVRRDNGPKNALTQALERVAPSKVIGLLLNEFPTIGDYADARYSVAKVLESSK
jgi:capsular exopolysaccharide synthesis family protein